MIKTLNMSDEEKYTNPEDILKHNLEVLNEQLTLLPKNSIKLSLDQITLGNILGLPKSSAGPRPITFRKGEEGEWEALFNVEKSEADDVEIQIRRFDYKDLERKDVVGIALESDEMEHIAYFTRFLQALFDAAASSKFPQIPNFWNRFKNTDILLAKSMMTGEQLRGGNVTFKLGQFKSSDEIEKFIIKGFEESIDY